MPFPTEHAARINDPKQYPKMRRENDKFASGIHVIWGITSEGKTEMQAIRFDKNKFTPDEAHRWLKNHDYKPIEFEVASQESAENEMELTGECMLLEEKLDEKKNGILVKVISPGWGDKGYYPADVLERDCKQVYKAGTQMFWNHQTEAQQKERPEGDLNELAGVTMTDGFYDKYGKYGEGVYTYADIFSKYKQPVKEMAPHIGASHRTWCIGKSGEAEGKQGIVVEALKKCVSIDFVTQAGAGGKIVEMFESAGKGEYGNNKQLDNQKKGENNMSPEEMKELESLRLFKTETEAKIKTLDEAGKKQASELQTKLTEAAAKIAKFEEADRKTTAKDLAVKELATGKLPKAAQIKIAESVSSNPPVKEGKIDAEALAKLVKESSEAELKYLQEVISPNGLNISDMNSTPPDEKAITESKNHTKEMKKSQYLKEGKSDAVAEQMATDFIKGW